MGGSNLQAIEREGGLKKFGVVAGLICPLTGLLRNPPLPRCAGERSSRPQAGLHSLSPKQAHPRAAHPRQAPLCPVGHLSP